jgi:hypothetical protein
MPSRVRVEGWGLMVASTLSASASGNSNSDVHFLARPSRPLLAQENLSARHEPEAQARNNPAIADASGSFPARP